jgi:NCS1 family nucleobase:cation symporter-1
MAMEKAGIGHIAASLRHGRPYLMFTLWLAANLTIADYALSALFYGLPVGYIALAILVGNVLGGLLLGLMAAMGPKFGYPQMMISRAYFGRKGNFPLAVANWLSTAGWFVVNIILGSFALQLATGVPFVAGAALLIAVQALLAVYGHDAIQKFEMVMAAVLGVMFIAVAVVAYGGAIGHLGAYEASASFDPYLFALAVAAVFSYLMSWSPYASDYSRYLPEGTSQFRVAWLAMAGGAIASAVVEFIGMLVYISVGSAAANPITALAQVAGGYSLLALGAIVLGVITANALNLYTNSLSAQIVYEKAKRWHAVILACAIGLVLAVAGATNFVGTYQNFLLTLDYWITPWVGIMIGAFFVRRIYKGVEERAGVAWRAVAAYAAGLLLSAPFMNLTSYGIPFEGFAAAALGGADVSYFVSFLIALAAYLLITRKRK